MAKKPDYRVEPEGLSQRSGCKVSWRTYATREEAEAAATVAIHNAEIDSGLGYDFGYCSPGYIDTVTLDNGSQVFEVCFP